MDSLAFNGLPVAWPADPLPSSRGLSLLRRLEALAPWAGETLVATSRLRWLLRQELAGRSPLPWGLRLRAWRHGFCAASWVVAELDRRDPREHVSDVVAVLAASRINGPARHLLNDKILFWQLMSHFPGLAPRIHAVLLDGRLHPGPDPEGVGDLSALAARLAGAPAILKPACSSHGHAVYLLEHDGETFRLDGRPVTRQGLTGLLRRLRRHLIEERVEQHPYAAALFPGTANTIRVLTMWDDEARAPFVAALVHRIGSLASAPADNAYRGGLWSVIDPATGELGPCLRYDRRRGRLERHRVHPDTNASLEGARVPGLGDLVAGMLAIARRLPFLPYVGWDVVLTNGGFRVLEGNNAPDLAHAGPLLRDERVRRFLGRSGRRRSTARARAA